jgi:hypothetical protein
MFVMVTVVFSLRYGLNLKYYLHEFEASTYYRNVFTLTLFPSEGRACVAWEHSNQIMLCLPSENKVSLTSSPDFLFASTLHLSFLSPYASTPRRTTD